jgi:hypothetical protein
VTITPVPAPVPAPRSAEAGAAAPEASDAPDAPDASAPTVARLLAFALDRARDRELIARLPLDPHERTWIRLDGPHGSEAWIIGWPPGTGTGWHDHGGSVGAFATAAGSLLELAVPDGGSAGPDGIALPEGAETRRSLDAGQGRTLPARHVHDVVNPSPTAHAISVHVYHPPLPLLRRYARTADALVPHSVEDPGDW